MEKVLRAKCPHCHERVLERVLQVPTPSVYNLMQIVIWPQQQKKPLEQQALLPDMETWLPGGKLEAWRESMSNRETLPRNALILPVYREHLPARCAPSALAVRGLHLTVRVILRRFSWNLRSFLSLHHC